MSSISQHPDLLALRARYERVAERPAARIVDGLIVLAGLYVALSPWIVGFDGDPRLARSNLVAGAVVALLGLSFGWAFERTHGTAWLCPVLGAWTIASLWLVQGSTPGSATLVSNVVAGMVVIVLGVAVVVLGRPGGRAATGH